MESNARLSLLVLYDDLCRHSNVLTSGCEREFRKYLENQIHFRQKVKNLDAANSNLLLKVNQLETSIVRLEAQLKQTKNCLIIENEKSQKLELEKNSLQRQIALIKEFLADKDGFDSHTKEKLVQMSSAVSQRGYSPNGVTVDKTGSLLSSDDETINGLNNCSSSAHCPKHVSKYSPEFRSITENSLKISENFFTQNETVERRRSMVTFRSSSEPSSTSEEPPLPRQMIRSDSEQIGNHAFEERKSFKQSRNSLPNDRYSFSGKLNRMHAFQTKIYIRSEKCHPCGNIIKFCKQGLKCSSCRISCHLECKELCPLPCVPVISPSIKDSAGTIADYTSNTTPMIPTLMVHCINEIEVRGLQDIGLYRIPGRDREIKELKEKFLKGKTVPSLSDVGIHDICGTVKDFLKSLKDSLITKAAWHTFVDAANHSEEELRLNLLYEAVCDLPQPNKESLAFLILHLHRVSASPLCKMPLDNISRVFAPTVIGYSTDNSREINSSSETKDQNKVMKGLLKIPIDNWQNIFNGGLTQDFSKLEPPESLPAPMTSRLGPFLMADSNPKTVKYAPRKKTFDKSSRKKFFPSPYLK